MELDYYLSLANIPNSLVSIRTINTEDMLQNLDVNFSYDDSSPLEANYTYFITFEKRRHHSQILISTYSPVDYLGAAGPSGYTIGINNTNELFIDYPKRSFSATFNIRLGNKNCIAVKKSGSVFSVYKYDIISGAIESSDSINIEESNINYLDHYPGGVMYSFGNPDYIAAQGATPSINYFSGLVDRRLILHAPIDESLIDIIFKGFRPETLTPSTSSSFTRSENYTWLSPELEAYKSYFSDAYRTFDAFLFTGSPGLSTGNFIAIEEAPFSTLDGLEFDVTYLSGISRCEAGGFVSPGLTATYYYSDVGPGVPNYTYLADVYISKHSGRMSVSREAVMTLSGTGYKFHYNSAYVSQGVTTGYTSFFDVSYYDNLKMDGVYSELTLEYLFSGQLKTPTGYHIQASYDFSTSSFYAPHNSISSSYYLNGQPEIYGVVNGKYITITGSNYNDYLEYDNTSNYATLGAGPSNYIQGRFYQNSSRVEASPGYRNLRLNSEYIETSTGHMYHLSKSQQSGTTLLFNL